MEGGEIWVGHDVVRRGMLMVSAAVGLESAGEREGAVEIQNKELARRLGERVGRRRREFEVGWRQTISWRLLRAII